jgi:hypothetical protein
MSLKDIVINRWFALFDLACVSACVLLWEMKPAIGGGLLLLALLPWLLRLFIKQFPFQRTPFDLPLAIFLLTAGMGVWAAYNKVDAWAKFWLLVGGILLFYSLAGQPQGNLWYIAGLIILFGMGTVCYFLLSNDWQQYPAKIGKITQAGIWFMKVRPSMQVGAISHTSVAGVAALTATFLVPIGVKAWLDRRFFPIIWVVVSGLILSIGFFMAISQGALFALGAGLSIGILWVLYNRKKNSIHKQRVMITGGALILLVILLTGFFIILSGGLAGLENHTPSLSMEATRLDLAYSGLKLIGDYPFTGGGLNAFPALYSTYILETPNFFVGQSNNLFIDITLEQSLAGLLAFCFVYFFSFLWIAKQKWTAPHSWLVWASLVSLMIVIIHGLSDDIIYYGWGIPMVFLVPGVTHIITRPASLEPICSRSNSVSGLILRISKRIHKLILWTMILVGLAILVLVYEERKPLLASWYANLGSINMDSVELVDFSSGQWDEGQHLVELKSAESLFGQALQYDTRNRTANYRLGLIAMLKQDYPKAVSYLNTAYQVDKNHRGIWKALGFSYVWSGRYDEALPLLSEIPEAKQELEVYPWWWRNHGQDVLAARAETMEQKLRGQGVSTPDAAQAP